MSEERIIDAEGRALGRVASDAARILMGKEDVDFAPNKVTKATVIIKNISKVKTDPKKMKSEKYYRHSGYIGNLKEQTMKEVWEKNPKEFFLTIVKRMLSSNSLTNSRLKRIKFDE